MQCNWPWSVISTNIRTTLRQLWDDFCTTLRQLWDIFGISFGPLWENFETTSPVQAGLYWRPLCYQDKNQDNIKISFEQLWDNFWTTLGQFWDNLSCADRLVLAPTLLSAKTSGQDDTARACYSSPRDYDTRPKTSNVWNFSILSKPVLPACPDSVMWLKECQVFWWDLWPLLLRAL